MKHARKLASCLLALILVFALSANAFAAQEGTLTGGSITINDAVPGINYRIYQLLYLESYNATSGAYAYKANSAWETWLKTQTTYLSFDAQGYVTWVDGADPAAFARLAQAQAKTMSADASAVAPAAAEGKTYSSVSFTGLKLGYYLVDTTLGTLCSLDTTNPSATMTEKNEVPVNVKTVEEDSTGTYGSRNDADIGQTVNFQSTITAQPGAENYVFHDTMAQGLTYTGVTGITLNGTKVDASSYSVVSTGLSDGCTFEVHFTQSFCDTLSANDKIVVSYTATLNKDAVIAGNGNDNLSYISYGDETDTKSTPPSHTKTYTWDVDILKFTMQDNEEVPLAGAVFTLSKSSDGANPIALIAKGNNVYRVATAGETGTQTEVTTDNTGKFTIEGLDSDTYYLTETKQPDGYTKLAGPVTIVIGNNGAVNATDTITQGVDVVKIENKAGTLLPSTGGMGTTVFYVFGALLAIGAMVMLVSKKRIAGR